MQKRQHASVAEVPLVKVIGICKRRQLHRQQRQQQLINVHGLNDC